MTQASFATHEVFNQSPPFEDVDLYAVDRPLMEAVAANGGADTADDLSEFGRHWGSAAMAARGRIANENTPKLRCFDARGFRRDQVIQMVQLTRQDCAIASAGLMRAGLAHALHHARHRRVFQKHLADQPLMQAVLSDMALHLEASIALVMRLCRSFDRTPHDANEAAYMRLLTPAVKFWVCKSAPAFLYEAMECLGGNGYVEEGILARHYREAPVNAIWEGSGNVMCLDVLRALSREGDVAATILQALAEQTKGLPGASDAAAFIAKAFRRPDGERVARLAGEKLALLAATAALNQVSPRGAELFAATRLATNHASMYGAVDLELGDVRALLDQALP
jgi:putative acyl-CoA dehydrogenase